MPFGSVGQVPTGSAIHFFTEVPPCTDLVSCGRDLRSVVHFSGKSYYVIGIMTLLTPSFQDALGGDACCQQIGICQRLATLNTVQLAANWGDTPTLERAKAFNR